MTSERGFPRDQYSHRLARAQALMHQHGLSAMLLSTEPEVRYFTGYLTRFWESPSRPWFLVVPAIGDPIAVIPSIGAPLMKTTWISDVRTWVSPNLTDDGVGLLGDTLREVVGPSGAIGVPSGHETHVRMPLADLDRLKVIITPLQLSGDHDIMRSLRMVKSEREIAKISTACAITDRAFARVHEIAQAGHPLADVFRQFQILCLQEGADWVPYLAGGAGPFGYGDVISPATETPLKSGDVLMLGTGLVWDGYFCDFDRNFAIGSANDIVQSAYKRLIDATEVGFQAARPGATASDVFHAMHAMLGAGDAASDPGRLGHGLGMQLTEWPSLIAHDHTVLEPGMVLTLEPSIPTSGGKMIVHEENIVILETGARYLSSVAPKSLPVI